MSENNEKKVHGIVAEYESVDSLLDACRRVRDAGYKKTDAFTPFAVHGIDKALGIKPTALPWIVLACGLAGTATALAMQIWMNAIRLSVHHLGQAIHLAARRSCRSPLS